MGLCTTQGWHCQNMVLNKGYVDEEYVERHCKGKRRRQPTTVPPVVVEPLSTAGLTFAD